MSGPLPAGKVPWQHEDRGAASGGDRGESERRGESAASGATGASGVERNEEVAEEQWPPFLASFSAAHAGWLVTLEVADESGHCVEVAHQRLLGVSLDRQRRRAYVRLGEPGGGSLTHAVPAPIRICWKETATGEHVGLDITSANGSTSQIRFRSVVRPEMADRLTA